MTTIRAEGAARLKAAFELTPDERKVVLLVTTLFVVGLVVRLVRNRFVCSD